MNRQILTWKLIADSLQRQVPVMLLYVLESKGSSPGRQGFFMAVNSVGKMEGSIGGGIMEHKFVEMAKEKLKVISDTLKVVDIKKQIHDKSSAKNQSGMICSGEQTILLYAVRPEDEKRIQHIINSLEQNKNGQLTLNPEGIRFSETVPSRDFSFFLRSENDWQYEEKTGYKNQLSIIGGGHCALALSNLVRPMDFYIRVYDDRKELKTMLENNGAHEKHYVNNYSDLDKLIEAGDNHYAVIMTFGYRTDDIAVRTLINKKLKYLGLLGSQSKIEKMVAGYTSEGIDAQWLHQIHMPVGIPIKSQTPEEIAVSIAAEIIRIKNRDL